MCQPVPDCDSHCTSLKNTGSICNLLLWKKRSLTTLSEWLTFLLEYINSSGKWLAILDQFSR